jgi:hypothetical protein
LAFTEFSAPAVGDALPSTYTAVNVNFLERHCKNKIGWPITRTPKLKKIKLTTSTGITVVGKSSRPIILQT